MNISNTNLITELICSNNKLEKELNELKLREKELSDQLRNLKLRNYNKDYFSSSRFTQRRLRIDVNRVIGILNNQLNKANLSVEKIIIREHILNESESKRDFIEMYGKQKNEKINLEKALYLKDKLLLSDVKYSDIVKEFKLEMPSIKQVKTYRGILNNNLKKNIIKIKNSYFVDIKKSISDYCMKYLLEKKESNSERTQNFNYQLTERRSEMI